MKISLIIPVYNEAQHISQVLKRIPDSVDEVVVVDDGSGDETPEIVRRFPVKLISHEKNMGKAIAMNTGIKNSSGDIVVFMDGDMQHDPKDIPRLVKPILANGADLTLSVRTLGDRKSMPIHRRFTNFCGNFLIKIFVGYDLKDTQSGFRAVRREFLRKMHFESVSYEVEMEMLIFAKRFEMRIVEVPIEIRYGKEKSHFKLRDILRIVKIVLEGRVR